MSRRLAAVLFAVLALVAAWARGASFFRDDDEHVKASLVTAEASVQPGRAFTVALKLEHQPGWHTYWIHAGTGYPTSLKWELPPGWTAGDIQWPTPEKILDRTGAITGNGYHGTVYLPVTLTPPKDLKVGENVTLRAKADWLMCEKECIPGAADVSVTLPVKAEVPTADPAEGAAVAAAVGALPRAESPWVVQAARAGKTVFVRLTLPMVSVYIPRPKAPWFFSDRDFVAYDQPQIIRQEPLARGRNFPGVNSPADASYVFELSLSPSADKGITRLTGVMRTEESWAWGDTVLSGLKIDVPLVEPAELGLNVAALSAPAAPLPADGLAGTLALALLGGLILNLMPCVFPVLGIKILGFARQAGEDRRKVARHGLVFAGGVLVSFWALAGALATLRAGGEQLGWGFQLQSPGFVFALAAVMLVFALNLSGVFEFGLGATGAGGSLQSQQGYTGSFFSGVLATVVATPCSAPFLAPALGAALALPLAESFGVFTAVGVGLSTPYLLLSVFPGAVKKLPRPGAWMETLKQFLAFPLYATAGLLLWVLAGQVDADAQFNAVLGLTVVALGVWAYGKLAVPGAASSRARLGFVVGAALLAAGAWLGWPQRAAVEWEPWSAERVAALQKEGRPIYVDFTARWCATCQTNKKLVFHDAGVLRAVREKKVALLRADWTNRDPVITAELAKWGRAAVPFNLVYLPGAAEPKVLPEVLTPGVVLEALK
jgi:thiol:disulfide interchange protein/DsbC/DsbD-like thiol-disulfide interchange protein